VGKGAPRAVPTIFIRRNQVRGHASLCPPYGSLVVAAACPKHKLSKIL